MVVVSVVARGDVVVLYARGVGVEGGEWQVVGHGSQSNPILAGLGSVLLTSLSLQAIST